MLSYANSMLNPLLYAAFNENFRVGFARACRCLGGRGGGGGNVTTGRVGGQSMTGRNATDQNQQRLTYRCSVHSAKVPGHECMEMLGPYVPKV